jgi:hypothetical protein
MGGVADERLEPQSYSLGICGGSAHRPCLLKQFVVDVERLLHMDDLAIQFHT